ncbi:MAG TPA: family 78 glycoside hydrolase catalytic domain [Anaerohalosphaeraceae bacterium]|nr:family 78 glycoside hydrolase catalytic domain [Anaerohalosphaeraceae bacterium]HOM76787.1 family 78 glycoside hydrolase catalytic domain [Anaerohalosphaeraceae bacterium]HPC64982.1 family 78 glycoside hydrolase catalytic domain [Anaerohalosphaeraceae bacterium]HPO70327.1 family 78 glycoside hydrolase catalytic domain [Anaerohalosphaeraceae bacterium]HRV21130.1 family 78 glycoside hydrolase catalytic domain [Anaerohalosphaeraceae bacterium]
MRRIIWTAAAITAVAGCVTTQTFLSANHRSDLQAVNLRCEHRTEPLGIDVVNPRLSWTLQSRQRGQRQTAYRVLVASDAALLKADIGNLWDSGRVESSQTFGLEYAGKPLESGSSCFWKVCVWDKDGKPSAWSKPALWSMGLLKKEDWQAEWVGLDLPASALELPAVLKKAVWIWSEAGAAGSTAAGQRFFRRSFELPADWNGGDVVCYITADNSFRLFVNGQLVRTDKNFNVIHEVPIGSYLRGGRNTLAVLAINEGNAPNPAGLLAAVQIPAGSGAAVEIVSDAQWRCSDKAAAGWTGPDCDDSDWTPAAVLGPLGTAPWSKTTLARLTLPPARYLRCEYAVADKPVRQARLYATALGIYQLYLNGQRVGDDYFSPGWTDYSRRIYYRTYDVTALLQRGTNALGAVLADGWFAGYVGYARQRNHYGSKLRLLGQLVIDYADGTRQVVATGPGWKGSLGPIQQADFLQGETYDARLEEPGWNAPGFDDSRWQKADVGGNEVSPLVQAAVSEPVAVFARVKPVSVSEPAAGVYVFDMGQNFAGVVQITVKGKAGQKIVIRHAERLNPDGTIYTANLRSAAATDTYICKGGRTEIWQPYFTFHGFQYVELTGLDSKPALDAVVGLALSSNTPAAGTIECSDAVVNKIQSNAVWTQRANFIDIPTDCPQRDERLGWTGDAQVYINTACYHNDVQAFFTKWLTDLTDAQRADGQFPMVAPLKVAGDDGGPAWADAGVICPWTIYKMYGDKRIIETHYEAMKKFIAFCKNRCTSDLLPPAQFHCFGDWLNIGDDTPRDVIYTAYFGCSTKLLAQMAEALDKPQEAAEYQNLFEQIKASFCRAYVQPDGRIKGDSQTAYVLAIAYELLDAQMQAKAAAHLVRRIEECGWHLSTGFVGTKDLMLVLAKIGRNDVAYRLLHNDTFPSWGFSVKHGATSIWERWNGWTPEQGFGDPEMNSFAHYSFGAVCQWMFENIGGIQTDGPAFGHILLKPQPGGTLQWAKTAYNSIRGPIRTAWEIRDGRFICEVSIPPNTTATLYLPAAGHQAVYESNKPISEAEGILAVSHQPGAVIAELESGDYRFSSYLP